MIRREEIANEATKASAEYRFGQFYSYNNDIYSGFIQGSEWADEHPKSSWINCKDKLPYEFENLLYQNNKERTLPVLVYNELTDEISIDFMTHEFYYWQNRKIWEWSNDDYISHWMPLPDKPQI